MAFLFTDTEGSTRLWEQDAEIMWRVLARHNDLPAQVVAAQGGVWFKAVGDAMQAAFPSCATLVPERLAACWLEVRQIDRDAATASTLILSTSMAGT